MSAGIITTDYVLPRHVKKRIYNMLRDMEILSFPSQIDLNYIDKERNDNLYLRVVINGEENIVSCRVPWGYNLKGVGEETVHNYQFIKSPEVMISFCNNPPGGLFELVEHMCEERFVWYNI